MIAPVRLCCGERHYGVVCPDGRVMCCICFEVVHQDDLSVDPDDGKRWDVCKTCAAAEAAAIERRTNQRKV